MKRLLLVSIAFSMLTISFAAIGTSVPFTKGTEIFLVISKNGERISLMDLTRISVKD